MRDLLSTQLRIPRFGNLVFLWRWFSEGCRVIFPRALRNSFWKPAYQISHKGAPISIERNLFGETRKSSSSTDTRSLPLWVELPPKSIFTTKIDLPREASRNVMQAIQLRFDEISPITLDRAVFDYKILGVNQNRLAIEIAIARKKLIDDEKQRHHQLRVSTIGAIADNEGNLQYIFEQDKDKNSTSALQKILHAIAAFVAPIILVIWALDYRLSQQAEALELYEDELAQSVRALYDYSIIFDGLDTVDTKSFQHMTFNGAIQSIEDFTSLAPHGTVIEELEVSGKLVVATGYTPDNANEWTQVQDSIRPGYSRFQARIQNGVLQ